MELSGLGVLITGPKRIGAVVAKALADRGADVALSYYRSRDEAEQAAEAVRAAGRWGGVDEIAKAVVFLIETDFITGEVIRVDGGRHLR